MACFIPTSLYGIIGWPLGQTMSPLIHNMAFQEMEIPAVYLAWPVQPESLGHFMDNLRLMRIRGLSVTIPHKVAVMALVENLSESAALAGAVNTLYWHGEELYGDNTDVTGFMAPLQGILTKGMSALILGAGGAARAVAAGLRMFGCHQVRVASPGNRHQYELAERFAFMPVPWAKRYDQPAALIINATPMGMHGDLQGESPYDFAKAPSESGWAYDLVYNPVKTRFLEEAVRAGRKTISGLEMFFGQGNAQFKLWTGESLPHQSREALEQALKVSGNPDWSFPGHSN